MAQAEFTTYDDEHEAVLVVRGEIDLATAGALRDHIHALVGAAGARAIVIDLADVTFLDSTGLEALLVEQAALGATRITLRRVPGAVRRVLEVTATIDRFDLEP